MEENNDNLTPKDQNNPELNENLIPENDLNKEKDTTELATPLENYAPRTELTFLMNKVTEAKQEIGKYLIGQHEMVDLLLIGVFTGGHVLLEGVPGIAKTLTAKVLSRSLSADFSRIQFTPDMMPSDIIGTSIFNMKTSEFNFKKGPIFTNIALIDEINRAPAKTQAALFEVMEEKQISYDGTTYEFDFPFLVIATQNPVEQEGTYRLPEAQLDRFLFKVNLNHPTVDEETEILKRFKNQVRIDFDKVVKVFSIADLKKIVSIIDEVKIEDSILNYIAQITQETRVHGKIYLGASPRASLSMLKASKALAAMNGRDFVIPDDIQYVAYHVLNHRMILTPEAEMEGMDAQIIIEEIIKKVAVPR